VAVPWRADPTYNANPLSMMADMATLQQLTPGVYAQLNTLTKRLGAELDAVFEEAGIPAQVTTVGSLFRVHFLPQRPRNYREAAQDNGKLHRRLLNHDILWSTAGNVSVPMGEGEVDRFVGAVAEALGEVG
jgi:glutamate-1-semialdehyde 2,1-aminomutase